MTWKEVIDSFLSKVHEIYKLNPAYKQPGDGSDGTCDCIGLAIGALHRMGLKWTGIHGCNWAARKEFVDLKRISSTNDLQLGDVVLKAHEQGEKGWDLPTRYRKGKTYYNGDLRDYYHAGVVTQLKPLNITHMSSKMTVDTKLGKWGFGGQLKILAKAAGATVPAAVPDPVPVPSEGARAVVVSANGLPVKMRQYPAASCRTWVKIPVGTEVTIVSPGEAWAKINYGSRKGWYMKAEFLDIIGDGKGKY